MVSRASSEFQRGALVRWLLDSDPSIRWQVMRDLCRQETKAVAAERARVAREGWGSQILAKQSKRGKWGGRSFSGWMTTIHTLILLKNLGVDPRDEKIRKAVARVKENVRWHPRWNKPFFEGETEPCLNGGILGLGAYFGEASDELAGLLLSQQLEDGGWNCEAPKSKRSSFHTTICVLEGLLEYESVRPSGAVKKARVRAQNYLLERGMFRGLRSGEVIDKKWLRFAFPPTWHYDVLRGLDYLRQAGVEPDKRVAGAIDVVIRRRHQNGRWPLNRIYTDQIDYPMDPGVGRASRWNTLRAMRVLDWYSSRHDHS
jgi:hypothetical protein